MEVDFADLSDDDLDDGEMKCVSDEFNYDEIGFDDSQFEKKTQDKEIMQTHKKLQEYICKFEKVILYTLMELNAEYMNYYNSLKAFTFDDNSCLLDVPIIRMDVEQIDKLIMKKQAERTRKEEPKKNSFASQFKLKFNY